MGEHDLALIALIKQSMITMERTFLKTANSFLIVQTEKNIQLPRIAPGMKERWRFLYFNQLGQRQSD